MTIDRMSLPFHLHLTSMGVVTSMTGEVGQLAVMQFTRTNVLSITTRSVFFVFFNLRFRICRDLNEGKCHSGCFI